MLRQKLEHRRAARLRLLVPHIMGCFWKANALREASGTQLDRIDQISFDRGAPVVQAALGKDAFAAAWAAGCALSLDQAVAEALGEAG